MRIAEIFHSIQGEGRLTGVPSVFVRTSGCNLRCWFCDTPYTSWNPEGENYSVDQLLEKVAAFDCEHVVMTGGEPMLVADVIPLTEELKKQGRHVTIETAGTVDLPVVADLMSISPKRPNSTPGRHTGWADKHEARRDQPDIIRRLTSDYDYQLKFVVDRPADVADVEQYLAGFPEIDPANVYLMPQAVEADDHAAKCEWARVEAERRGWRLAKRLHIELFGNRRGV
jgi:7-carboxy-7-deazaguanine synthase